MSYFTNVVEKDHDLAVNFKRLGENSNKTKTITSLQQEIQFLWTSQIVATTTCADKQRMLAIVLTLKCP
jgi:hypothetical protein